MRDTDGDGRADEFKTFAEMESPRGVIWDGPSGTAPGTLYVMHPPNLTAFTDTDGDGKADKQEDILTGLGFDLGFRGADHTTNGCRLAIDGFIYIAVGDYGFIKARREGRHHAHQCAAAASSASGPMAPASRSSRAASAISTTWPSRPRSTSSPATTPTTAAAGTCA